MLGIRGAFGVCKDKSDGDGKSNSMIWLPPDYREPKRLTAVAMPLTVERNSLHRVFHPKTSALLPKSDHPLKPSGIDEIDLVCKVLSSK